MSVTVVEGQRLFSINMYCEAAEVHPLQNTATESVPVATGSKEYRESGSNSDPTPDSPKSTQSACRSLCETNIKRVKKVKGKKFSHILAD